MGAGISTKAKNAIVYRRLKSIQKQLQRAGIKVSYRKGQLFPLMTGDNRNIGFNIKFRFIYASNGESAGWPVITVVENGEVRTYNEPLTNNNLKEGIDRIIEVFQKPLPQTYADAADFLYRARFYVAETRYTVKEQDTIELLFWAEYQVRNEFDKPFVS